MPNLSIIIATYDSEPTIFKCLDSIFHSSFKDFEVIVSDDCSLDKTVEIIQGFPCKIIRNENHIGRSEARNLAVQQAAGEVYVFIDSDVIIKEDTLSAIHNLFKERKGIDGVTGLLSKEHPNKNFFSQYKNLYMNFIFHKVQNPIDFLYGSLFALRKSVFEPFDSKGGIADDTDLGKRLSMKGHNLIIDKTLEVIHLKKYNFVSFIRNEFQIPYSWALQFIQHAGHKDILKKRRFAHASMNQLVSIANASLLFLTIILSWTSKLFVLVSLFLALLFMWQHMEFYRFLKRERGDFFFLKAVPTTFIEASAKGLGILSGFICSFVRKKRNNNSE